ncbi:hypothetical protein HB13667_19955 [Pseudomonas putida]|uniref:Uncharacterized protein n=1 Tax=Pseudomonas putida TaxID=303 RepID=A0A0P7CJU5_PSEPU|nr:hypothetical protein HB13667_19955 [Pseudomonas putida]
MIPITTTQCINRLYNMLAYYTGGRLASVEIWIDAIPAFGASSLRPDAWEFYFWNNYMTAGVSIINWITTTIGVTVYSSSTHWAQAVRAVEPHQTRVERTISLPQQVVPCYRLFFLPAVAKYSCALLVSIKSINCVLQRTRGKLQDRSMLVHGVERRLPTIALCQCPASAPQQSRSPCAGMFDQREAFGGIEIEILL